MLAGTGVGGLLPAFTVGIAGSACASTKLTCSHVSLAVAPLGAFVFALVPALLPLPPPAGVELSMAELAATASNWPSLAALQGVSLFGGIFVVPLFAYVKHASRPITAPASSPRPTCSTRCSWSVPRRSHCCPSSA